MLNGLSPWHLAILVIVLIVLFGAKRLPDAARSVGRSMKIFKAETKGMRETDESKKDSDDPDMRQLPQGEAAPRTGDDVAEMQRQLDELKKQQADQAHKNAS
ncbi:MAG: Sec-independent protein translocase subunit TatA [Haloechinothrix sp.]